MNNPWAQRVWGKGLGGSGRGTEGVKGREGEGSIVVILSTIEICLKK